MAKKKPKLELTWIGKENRPRLEPRILLEDQEKSYHAEHKVSDGDIFDNMLIHGDNLLALRAIEHDYAGQIKCIYIDPPYNTGAAFDKYNDGVEHSIWLSLMRERLYILRKLLRKDGLIWISMDDNEVHYLKVLLDEIFGRDNFLQCLPTVMNLKGNQDEFGFAGTHEYTLVYAKDKANCKLYEFPIDEEELEKWSEDDYGPFKKGAPLRATGDESTREDRPNMFYPILVRGDEITTIEEAEFKILYDKRTKKFNDKHLEKLVKEYGKLGYASVLPMEGKESFGRWRWAYNTQNKHRLSYDAICLETKNGLSLYKKQRPELGQLPTKKPKSIFYKPEYSSGTGTAQIKSVFGRKVFDYPKPEELIHDFLFISTRPGDLILDSFLGSGTTAAVAHKMGRRWIGIELGDQCHELCAPRMVKVIDALDPSGVTAKTDWQGGGGFRYYNLAPTLITTDKWGNEVINPDFNPAMLTEAVCKIEGFKYAPDADLFWKQGYSTERDFIYVTTQHLNRQQLSFLSEEVGDQATLLVCCGSYTRGSDTAFENLTVKKLPKAVLKRCEWGHDDYSLKVENLPKAPEPLGQQELEIE